MLGADKVVHELLAARIGNENIDSRVTCLGPLDENHSVVCEDDGQVANLGVGLVLVLRAASTFLAPASVLDKRLTLCE